mmetsp:Transcript_42543/g.122994  ORF Transcript_42543/g.122994 Transcript_42543/m.122994 type:complete len:220 (-) Transcript_42543:178-837(-)
MAAVTAHKVKHAMLCSRIITGRICPVRMFSTQISSYARPETDAIMMWSKVATLPLLERSCVPEAAATASDLILYKSALTSLSRSIASAPSSSCTVVVFRDSSAPKHSGTRMPPPRAASAVWRVALRVALIDLLDTFARAASRMLPPPSEIAVSLETVEQNDMEPPPPPALYVARALGVIVRVVRIIFLCSTDGSSKYACTSSGLKSSSSSESKRAEPNQ